MYSNLDSVRRVDTRLVEAIFECFALKESSAEDVRIDDRSKGNAQIQFVDSEIRNKLIKSCEEE